MAAGLYTYPLFVTLLAGPVLGERVGPWRIGALLLGSGGFQGSCRLKVKITPPCLP
jgi:drug/metabolite transporter (DMT)-like permease